MAPFLISLLLLLAGLFYLLIPGLGAFFVRSRWRKFRAAVIAASLYPKTTYAEVRGGRGSGDIRNLRFLGVLEAIQEDDVIWLKNEEIVLSADMKGQKVYLLPSLSSQESEKSEETNEWASPGEVPAVVSWEKVSSLPEGIKVLIAGPFHAEENRGIFRSRPGSDLVVIFYDGGADSIVRRALWNGRQRNEYWNPFTPGALAGGTLAGMIFAYFFLKNPFYRIPAILSVGISMIPLIPLFPPGVAFFIFYRRLWSGARLLRAERDLVRLPLRYFPDGNIDRTVALPNGENYGCRIYDGPADEVLRAGGKIRTTLIARREGKNRFYWFGILNAGEARPSKSADPLIETVVTPGHPEELAAACEKRAGRMEIVSILFFCLGFGVNFLLALRGLALLIR